MNNRVVVFWNYHFADEDNTSNDTTPALSDISEHDDSANSCSDDDCNIETVPFKCIGSGKEKRYQDVLREICERLRKDIRVDVQLVPEPNNLYDSQAIQFMCEVDGENHTIGYVVSECLSEVHQAIQRHSIVKVEFAWVKFRSYRRSIPQYYAAINITSSHGWSSTVKRSASSFY